jgi:hypothetical protein
MNTQPTNFARLSTEHRRLEKQLKHARAIGDERQIRLVTKAMTTVMAAMEKEAGPRPAKQSRPKVKRPRSQVAPPHRPLGFGVPWPFTVSLAMAPGARAIC